MSSPTSPTSPPIPTQNRCNNSINSIITRSNIENNENHSFNNCNTLDIYNIWRFKIHKPLSKCTVQLQNLKNFVTEGNPLGCSFGTSRSHSRAKSHCRNRSIRSFSQIGAPPPPPQPPQIWFCLWLMTVTCWLTTKQKERRLAPTLSKD